MFYSSLTSSRARQIIVTASLGLVSTSCDGPVTASVGHIASIKITPASLAINTGAARPLDVTVLDETGAIIGGAQVFWSARNPSVATVSPQGIVTAVAPGKTEVAASKGGKSAVAPVTVSALPAALVRVSPTSANVFVGATTTLAADVLDTGGGRLTGHPISWASASAAIATVSASGVVTGVSPGNVVISATAAGLTGTAVVSVRLVPVASVVVAPSTGTVTVGKTLQLAPSLVDAAGRILTGRPIAWTTTSASTATVTSAGLVRGVARGTTSITATSEGKSGSATITVP